MATITKQWESGGGSVTLDFDGQGNGTITVTSDPNTSAADRSLEFTVKTISGDNVVSKTITVSQQAYVITKPYLKFKALESGTFTLTIPASITSNELSSISYSTDNGSSWVATQNSDSVVTITTPTISAGSSVLWKGSGTAMGNTNEGCQFASTCRFECSGNIMSLLYGDNFEEQITIPSSYCFYSLFRACTNLEKAPELPATTLTYACYKSMFYGCSNLTTAPVLPATTVTFESYAYMFYHCSNLNYIKMMAKAVRANTLSNWVNGVAASGTFVKNVNATWSGTGNSGVPNNWTVETASS